jgi:hypothetical protein
MRTISCSFLLLAQSLCGQVVSPAHFTKTEANTYAYIGPGSTSTPDRILQVHDDLGTTSRSLTGVAFRRDGSLSSASYNYAAYTILCDIFVSNAATTSATTSTVFDTNHGANKTQVGAFRLAQFPATTHSGAPAPFDYKITFAQPWVFNGVGALCLDIKFTSKTNTATVYLDYQSTASSTNPGAYDEARGTGCKATTYTQPVTLSGSSTPNWPANSLTLNWSGNYLPKSSLVYLCLGASDKVWTSLPLPLPLPGTGGMPSGTCTVYTDWSVQIPSLANATGGMSQNIGFPVNAFMNGLNVYSQLVALDAAANIYGGVMSNLQVHQVIAPYTTIPVSLVYSQSGLPVNGTLNKNQGYVVQFL